MDLGIDGIEEAVEIGRGGFAVVYRARQPHLARDVAVKVLTVRRLDAATLDRFHKECRAVGQLSGHPHIAPIYESGEGRSGAPHIIMPYYRRGTLADAVAEHGTLHWSTVLDIGVKLAGAVSTAHEAGVLHRDIKPANILRSDFDDPILADFGVARIEQAVHVTESGPTPGSISHAAPEFFTGAHASERSDLFSLAATLYTLIRGRPPFVRDADDTFFQVMHRALNEDPPDLRRSGVPPQVVDALDTALRRQPDERPTNADAFGTMLQRAQRGLGLAVTPTRGHDEALARPKPATRVVATIPLGGSSSSRGLDRSARGGIPAGESADGKANRVEPLTDRSASGDRSRLRALGGRLRSRRRAGALAVALALGGGAAVVRAISTDPPPPDAPAQVHPTLAGAIPVQTPGPIAVGPDGSLFVAEGGALQRLKRLEPDGTVHIVAGGGSVPAVSGQLATDAAFPPIQAVAVGPDGVPVILAGDVVYRIARGVLEEVTRTSGPGLAIASTGDLFTVDANINTATVHRSTGRDEVIDSSYFMSNTAEGLNHPTAITVAPNGTIYIADTGDHEIVTPQEASHDLVVAGTREPGFAGDGGPANAARLFNPGAVAADRSGNLYIADSGNNRVRRVGPDGRIVTVVGTGRSGYDPDSDVATQANVGGPRYLAVGPDDILYVSSPTEGAVFQISPDGALKVVVLDFAAVSS